MIIVDDRWISIRGILLAMGRTRRIPETRGNTRRYSSFCASRSRRLRGSYAIGSCAPRASFLGRTLLISSSLVLRVAGPVTRSSHDVCGTSKKESSYKRRRERRAALSANVIQNCVQIYNRCKTVRGSRNAGFPARHEKLLWASGIHRETTLQLVVKRYGCGLFSRTRPLNVAFFRSEIPPDARE